MNRYSIPATGRAPGKAILFGEHAVVYGRPALAVPISQVRAEVTVEAGPAGRGPVLWAADLPGRGEEIVVREAADDHPLAAIARLALARLELADPDWRVTIHSTIPIASGLGSGAAVSTAIVRGLAAAARVTLPPGDVSDLVYEVEKLHHGTPSGIDNTVIAYEQPVYYRRGQAPEPFAVGRPFMLAIADSGIASPTKVAVGDVRRGWQAEPERFEALFDRVAAIVEAARAALAGGQIEELGGLMNANHTLLVEMGVSCPELDCLAAAACAAGAAGAKLSGGGRGGNLIALVDEESAGPVAAALLAASAVNVILTMVAA